MCMRKAVERKEESESRNEKTHSDHELDSVRPVSAPADLFSLFFRVIWKKKLDRRGLPV